LCGPFVQTPIKAKGSFALPQLVGDLVAMPASYNVAPIQRASVLLDRGADLQLTRMACGLMPFWAKAKTLQGSTINARLGTVATNPAFRSAFKKRRRLVPIAGYYEWSVSAEDGKKEPWLIHGAEPLRAARLCEDTTPLLDADNLGTFTVVTDASSGVSADIHDRMPIWLPAALAEEWLAADVESAMALLLATEVPLMDAYRVNRALNAPRNNQAELLEPPASKLRAPPALR